MIANNHVHDDVLYISSGLHLDCDIFLFIIDEALKRYIKPHHVHIGSHLACFFLNYSSNRKYPYITEKKWSQNGSTPEAVSWYLTQLHPWLHPPRWHRFPKRLQGGAVLAPLFFSVIISYMSVSSSQHKCLVTLFLRDIYEVMSLHNSRIFAM